MNKTFLLVVCVITCFTVNVFGQARSELNIGLIGVNYEIPVHKDITIAPGASTSLDFDWITLNVKGNYYFDNLFDLTAEAWDVYGGVGAGYAIYSGSGNTSSGFDIGLHVGGRWFWNDKWGVYLELGGASTQGATGGIGVTMKL
ncbi:hypothetical protein [Algibacter mikhailovii]|uniref:hypothetical protein n=1 Tax=Algibacter mikhailovii TaxID=425498 RepID=UPI002494FAE7|nr:hypothetical protein [Algibacter mikhailovii]